MTHPPMLGPILLTEASEEFLNGYQVGLLRFRLEEGSRVLTDREVYEVLARIVFDTHTTDRYRAGVIAGWFAGLFAQCVRLGYTVPTLLFAPSSTAATIALSSSKYE